MLGDARDFNDIETRAVTEYFFFAGQGAKEMHAILSETLEEYSLSYATVKKVGGPV
jgi:hypothetical protein